MVNQLIKLLTKIKKTCSNFKKKTICLKSKTMS
jgi:hypothetical protein